MQDRSLLTLPASERLQTSDPFAGDAGKTAQPAWLSEVGTDIYVGQAVKVISDILDMKAARHQVQR